MVWGILMVDMTGESSLFGFAANGVLIAYSGDNRSVKPEDDKQSIKA